MFPFLLVPKNKELIQYCSERVRDDWTKDGGNPPKEKAFSPCDLDVFCKNKNILNVIKEYV